MGETRLGSSTNALPEALNSCVWHSWAVRLDTQVVAGLSLSQAHIPPSGSWGSIQPWPLPSREGLSEDTCVDGDQMGPLREEVPPYQKGPLDFRFCIGRLRPREGK
jgi:hypothetical protein